MNTQPEIEALSTYARNASYIEEPDSTSYSAGVEPLDTLPAAWWNWFLYHLTNDEALLATNLNALYEEAINVLTQAGIEPDETQKNQLYAAINTLIQQKSSELQTQIDAEVIARTEADSDLQTQLDTSVSNLNEHVNNESAGVHGASSSLEASRIIIRDADGRAQVATPSDDNDIATKHYVDNAVSGTVDMYKALTSIQGTEALIPLSLFSGFVYDSSHRYAAIALFISSTDTYLVTSCYVTSSGVQVYPKRIENNAIVDGTGRTQLAFGSFTFGNNYTFGQVDTETYVPVLIYIFDGGSV